MSNQVDSLRIADWMLLLSGLQDQHAANSPQLLIHSTPLFGHLYRVAKHIYFDNESQLVHGYLPILIKMTMDELMFQTTTMIISKVQKQN